jgi:hypothetical protein
MTNAGSLFEQVSILTKRRTEGIHAAMIVGFILVMEGDKLRPQQLRVTVVGMTPVKPERRGDSLRVPFWQLMLKSLLLMGSYSGACLAWRPV